MIDDGGVNSIGGNDDNSAGHGVVVVANGCSVVVTMTMVVMVTVLAVAVVVATKGVIIKCGKCLFFYTKL